jgi:hypothetical protein
LYYFDLGWVLPHQNKTKFQGFGFALTLFQFSRIPAYFAEPRAAHSPASLEDAPRLLAEDTYAS